MKSIVIFGAGAVGSTVGGWIYPHHPNLYFLARGTTLKNLQADGFQLYAQNDSDDKSHINAQAIASLSEIDKVDYLFITTKTYALDAIAKQIVEQVGNQMVIVAFQNGVENQKILSKYFPKVIYCVVGYNAWSEGQNEWVYQKRGPLILGTPDPTSLSEEKAELSEILNQGVETHVVTDFQSAAHTKIIMNLANSLTTLIGHTQKPVSSLPLFQKILTNMTYEGVKVMKAASYRESKIGGLPSWLTLTIAAKLPGVFTRGIFKKNIKKMVLSSMAQDILKKRCGDSELDIINGRVIELADQYNVSIPYNRAIYEICREEFAKKDFKPIDITDVWNRLKTSI